MTLYCFLFHCPLHFKFPLSTIVIVDHVTIDIIQNQFTLQEAVLMTQMGVPDHLFSHYRSLINNMHDEHHMNERDVHFGKYGSGLPLQDIHLLWIWNLWTRTGVMLWSLISSGTCMILLSCIMDSFSFQHSLCASSITSFVIAHSHLSCYL